MAVKNSDTVRTELLELKETTGLGWREIAKFPQYAPIPFGTLSAIAKGYPIPKRWRKRLGIGVKPKRLFDLPTKQLRWMLEHRQEIT